MKKIITNLKKTNLLLGNIFGHLKEQKERAKAKMTVFVQQGLNVQHSRLATVNVMKMQMDSNWIMYTHWKASGEPIFQYQGALISGTSLNLEEMRLGNEVTISDISNLLSILVVDSAVPTSSPSVDSVSRIVLKPSP